MEEKKWKAILKGVLVVATIIFVVYIYKESGRISNHVPRSEFTYQEELEFKIEELKDEIREYEDEIDELNGRLDNLQSEYNRAEELIGILQDQLKNHGIEPEEL